MGNGWGGYGETVMGSKGTLLLDREQEVLLFKDSDTSTKVGVKDDKGGPTLDTQASGKGPSLAKAAADMRPRQPRLHRGDRALGLVHPQQRPRSSRVAGPRSPSATRSSPWRRNVAIDNSNNGKGGYLKFEEGWYDINDDATPDGSSVKEENDKLGAKLS